MRIELRISVGEMAQKGDTNHFTVTLCAASSARVCSYGEVLRTTKRIVKRAWTSQSLRRQRDLRGGFPHLQPEVPKRERFPSPTGVAFAPRPLSACAGAPSVVMAADGQVTLGDSVMKHSAKKIRRLYQDKVLAGFAGSTADAFSLFSRFEGKLEQYAGNLGRAAVELAKEWRTDKMLRQLEALLIVADPKQTFLISGTGDVIEPDEGIATIG